MFDFRIDNPDSDLSSGFNYRYGNYYYLQNLNGTAKEYRDLFKVYGLRIVFLLAGQGRQFSIVPLMVIPFLYIHFNTFRTINISFFCSNS
jgi:hypothetical protein